MLSPRAETWAIVYAGGRTLAAIVSGVMATRRGAAAWWTMGQGISDAACVLFLLAYLDYELRDVVRFFAPVLLAYVVFWEVRSLVARSADDDEPAMGAPAGIVLGMWLRVAHEVLMILPPVVAGAFLVFDLIFPRQWPFPNTPDALQCEPTVFGPADRVTLRMAVPHGGELGVFTPRGRFLYLVEFAPGGTPRSRRFEGREQLTLSSGATTGRVRPGAAPEPVFSDTGLYTFRLSDAAELSASLMCSVRFVGPPQ